MKFRMLAALLLIVILVQSCSRAMTPYEAANNPRGKNCRAIK